MTRLKLLKIKKCTYPEHKKGMCTEEILFVEWTDSRGYVLDEVVAKVVLNADVVDDLDDVVKKKSGQANQKKSVADSPRYLFLFLFCLPTTDQNLQFSGKITLQKKGATLSSDQLPNLALCHNKTGL